MTNRLIRTLAVIALVAPAGQALVAQAPRQSESRASAAAASFNAPRTAWGDPDLQGYWLPNGGGRMETPAGKPWEGPAFTPADVAFSSFFPPEAPSANAAPARPRAPQGPMVIDPPDGRIPMQPWAMAKRTEIVAHQDKVELLDPRVRCLQSGLPRANLPVGYNTYQFLQVPGFVVLLYEWNHMYRYVPLDGRPHVSPNIRLPMGDSRGRWEGNTLVVDVTNFTDTTWVVGHGAPPDGAPASAIATASSTLKRCTWSSASRGSTLTPFNTKRPSTTRRYSRSRGRSASTPSPELRRTTSCSNTRAMRGTAATSGS